MDQAQQRKRTVSYIVNIADHELPGHHSLGVNVVRYDRQSHTLISGGRDGVVSVWRPEGKEEEYGEKGYGEKGYGEKEYGEKEYGEKENIEEKEYVQEKEYGEEEYEQYGEKQHAKKDYRIKQNANPFAGRSAEANIFTNLNNAEDIKRYIAENVGNEEAVEQLEQQINSESIAGEPVRAGRYKLADTCHRHLDWVRDVKILGPGNRERTELKLATCSNDFSVKIWRTSREAPVMSTVGYHDDYVSCLGYTGQQSHYGAQLVSGGLDKEVKVWDLGRQCAADGFRFAEEKGSVYAVDCFGNCVVAGGPTGVVTLFDRRDMKRPARHFLGHTDTIRGLKMGGKSFVSCSSDTRVCLWDLRVNRAMRIFDMHNSPVWSLYVPSFGDDNNAAYDCDPSFDVLYTGDSDGLVVKTDLRASDLDPELVGPHKRGYLNDRVNSNLGISTVVADLSVYKTGKESAGVLGITGGDGTIWTASAVAKDRYLLNWEVPNTTRLAVYQGIRLYENLGVLSNANDLDDHLVLSSAPLNRSGTSGAISITASISNDNSDIVSQFSHEDMNQIDAALATPFGVDEAVLGAGSDEDQELGSKLGLKLGSNPGQGTQGDTPGEAKVRTLLLSLNGGPSTEYVVRDEVGEKGEVGGKGDGIDGVNKFGIDGVRDSKIDGDSDSKIDGVNDSKIDGVNDPKIDGDSDSKINVVNNSFSAHPNRHVQINSQKVPDHAVEVVTFNEAPLQSIDGSNGLVLSRLLNNRRHVATMDQNGCIYVIDIVQCGLVRKIDTRDARYAIGSVSDCLDDEDRFEQITDGLQTDESLPQWCSVQTKGGMLFITLNESSFTSCEIYEDEFLHQYAGRALGMEREEKKDENSSENSSSASSISSKPTPRYNLGKVVLKSLFCDFIGEAFTSQQIKIRATIRAKERSEEEREMKSLHKLSVWKTLSRTKSGGRDKTDGRRSLRSVSSSSAASMRSSGDKDTEKKKKKKKKGFFKRYLHHGKHDEDDEDAAKDKHGGSEDNNGGVDVADAQTEEERKKFLEKEYRKQLQDEIMGLTTTKQVLDWMDERGISGPDGVMLADEDDEKKLNTPYFKYDKKIMVTINENIRTYGTDTKTLFLTHMGEQKDLYSSLEDLLPAWVSRAVLLDAYEHIPGRKVEFTVEPDISGLPGLQKLNSNKLSANSLLRIDRVIAYVKGKLPESEKHGQFEILCRGNVLDNKATLNTVKNRIWKSSGNVQLIYRKKKC